MIEVPLRDLEEMARYRPAGYYDDVVAHGEVKGDVLLIEDGARRKLAVKWEALQGRATGGDEPPALPTLDAMAKNFWGSLREWIGRGFPVAPRLVFRARLRQCKTNVCGQWRGDLKVARCAACGCTGLKLWLATETCPKGYWSAVPGMVIAGWLRRFCSRPAKALQEGH